jgi:Holliday junction resolvase-like predicted endonuclease
MECPSKLFYTAKKELYYDNKVDNDFLKALAEGGFQVGELAKRYFPGGVDIEALEYATALEQTAALMLQNDAIIYEAAFRFNDFFIRADIIVKKENTLQLIEVKAKSIDTTKDSFTKKDGNIQAKWKPYLDDIAFQKYVVQKSYPELNVRASLMLTDKTKTASVNGLNQLFFLYQQEGRNRCRYTGSADITLLGDKILTVIPVDDEIDKIHAAENPAPFEELINSLAEKYKNDEKIIYPIGGHCGKCEFRLDREDKALKSGFHECWKAAGVSAVQLQEPLVLDLWYFLDKDQYIKKGIYGLKDLKREDLEPKTKKKVVGELAYLSRIDRQELQITKTKEGDSSRFIDKNGLITEMNSWKFPLHFIDFETTSVAIPFNAGRKPYEQIAFQYSHHIVKEDGTIEHIGEWISTAAGRFPNFDFIRALKKELENDQGTIFRYSNHENSILNAIYRQLKESNEEDREHLCEWIKTITASTSGSADQWTGARAMVDLLEVVKKYYYDPLMGGSNSIKKVLPAVLATSAFLKNKYGVPAYGTAISSLNYKDHTWISYDQDGKLINPYNLLPPIHHEVSNESLDEFLIDEEVGIADGGAAMIAFARMQFTEMSDPERQRVKQALLNYCELDTLAMVMIYEAWKDWCK